MPLTFDNTYRLLPERMYAVVGPDKVRAPRLIAVNRELGEELGLSPEEMEEDALLPFLSGNEKIPGSSPIALAYAGHQFGGFSHQLGDGRAHLLGEVIARDGRRFDIQLKGSGRTPFSRGGDGKSALGPVLREYLVSETMHALGVPTTRALAAVATGELVARETSLPGGVMTRIASSHIRVGTFEYFRARGDVEALQVLTEHALNRHYPDADDERPQAVRLLDGVIAAQARLIAHWMSLGFVHGVMNTDNCSISGETIDYGPCAFIDSFDPARTFSSIDRSGRYAFNQQPQIAQWNLARLAEALLPILDSDESRAVALATDLLEKFPARFNERYRELSQRKLGLTTNQPDTVTLAGDLLTVLSSTRADFTLAFRHLYELCQTGEEESFLALFAEPQAAKDWLSSFRTAFKADPGDLQPRLEAMRLANPLYIPRNHRIEEAIAAALQGDDAPFHRLRRVLRSPCEVQPGEEELAMSPGDEQWSYRTFCGT